MSVKSVVRLVWYRGYKKFVHGSQTYVSETLVMLLSLTNHAFIKMNSKKISEYDASCGTANLE